MQVDLRVMRPFFEPKHHLSCGIMLKRFVGVRQGWKEGVRVDGCTIKQFFIGLVENP